MGRKQSGTTYTVETVKDTGGVKSYEAKVVPKRDAVLQSEVLEGDLDASRDQQPGNPDQMTRRQKDGKTTMSCRGDDKLAYTLYTLHMA